MRCPLELSLSTSAPDSAGFADIRLTVFNPTTEPVVFDRRLLFGPQPGTGDPLLLASEPARKKPAENLIVLNPLCFYGRQRRYQYRSAEVTFHGYLLDRAADGLLPTGPTDPARLAAAATPLTVAFGG
jgi:hypothetical protein